MPLSFGIFWEQIASMRQLLLCLDLDGWTTSETLPLNPAQHHLLASLSACLLPTEPESQSAAGEHVFSEP